MYINGKLVGNELKSLRTKNNLSLEQVSQALSLHFNSLSKYEKDASDMQLGTFKQLLNYYGIDEIIFFKVIREYNHDIKGNKQIEE